MCLKCHIRVKHFFVYAKNVFTRTIYICFVFTPATTMIHRKVDIVFYFFFLCIQIICFQTKRLQSPDTYISERIWDPCQKAITK